MPKVSDYLNLRNLLATGTITTAALLSACTPETAVQEIARYDKNGNELPISRVVAILDNIGECADLGQLTDSDQFKAIVSGNLERVASDSGLSIRKFGEPQGDERYIPREKGITRYSNQRFIDVFSRDPTAIAELRINLESDVCNPPGQKMSFHQTFNQEQYGSNGALKPQYAPKQLRL